MSTVILQVLLSVLGLGTTIFLWWRNGDAKKEEKFNAEKQAIKDAIASGDNARIHAIIDGMRR